MGMFDTMCLEAKCPYCHIKQLIELHKKGSKLPKKDSGTFNISAIGSCRNPVCFERGDKSDIILQDTQSEFGSLFDAKVEIIKGKVTGKVFAIKKREEYTDKYLKKNKRKWFKKFVPRTKSNWVYMEWNKRKKI